MIIYGSQYGSAKWYAQKLGNRLNMEVLDVTQFKKGKEPIVFVSSLYAGGFKGAKAFIRTMKRLNIDRFVLVSCGLADPNEESVKEEILRHAHHTFSSFEFQWFGVRGAIDYDRLSKKHRIMMKMLKTVIEKKGLQEQNKEFLETYGKAVSFCDESRLDEIEAFLCRT